MLGSKEKPKGVVSYLYRKILFDKGSEVYYVTVDQLEEYKKNDIDRIIKDHQDGVTTMKHQIEIAELISITYDCFFGISPTIRHMAANSPLPYIFTEYHPVYNDAWIANILRLLNSYKIGKGHWYGYSKFAKMDAIRSVKAHCKRLGIEEEMLEEYEIHAKQCYTIVHDRFYTDTCRSALY